MKDHQRPLCGNAEISLQLILRKWQQFSRNTL